MGGSGKLGPYRGKRDFRQTGEPAQDDAVSRGERPRFVIQKHDASNLHYDLRLEIDGVLVSWAVPKGLSTDPRTRRLAIRTEDHPLSYIDFEGVIPRGEYGAGTVLVWDAGAFRNLRADKADDGAGLGASLDEGLLEVWLEGDKLSGGYVIKRIAGEDASKWLVIKRDDQAADARRRPTSTEPQSVKSGRSLDEVAAQADAARGGEDPAGEDD
jgi:DNA ligase D-like protein (predicted 3'-phosphoesterase)